MNINIKTLEKVYSECGITTPFSDFISALKAEMKSIKHQKKLKRIEEASIIHIDYEFSDVKIPIEDFIKNQIEEESDILSDVFYYEDFPDEGDERGCTLFGDVFIASGHDGSYLFNIKTGEFKDFS